MQGVLESYKAQYTTRMWPDACAAGACVQAALRDLGGHVLVLVLNIVLVLVLNIVLVEALEAFIVFAGRAVVLLIGWP